MPDAKLCLKSYQPLMDTHSHDFHQLVLPVTGSLDIEIGHHSGIVTQQQAAVICASENHAVEGSGKNQFIVADIPIQLAPAFSNLPVFVELDDNVNRYIHFLQAQLDSNNITHQQNPLMQRQMLLLLVQLLDERHQKNKLFDKRVDAARQYLERNFQQKNALENAAYHACLSTRHLRQLFNQYYDMSPSQYLLELRMQAAWQLLCNTQLNIQLVAERCGYTSVSAFSDRVHKHFSHSPLNIRRLNK
jgi:AraC-like DNA-binding protein